MGEIVLVSIIIVLMILIIIVPKSKFIVQEGEINNLRKELKTEKTIREYLTVLSETTCDGDQRIISKHLLNKDEWKWIDRELAINTILREYQTNLNAKLD